MRCNNLGSGHLEGRFMNTYDIESEAYLGAGQDMAHHPFHAFRVDQEIHIVYHLGEQDQYVAKEDVHKVSSNPDKYLWTPFVQFVPRKL